MVDPFTALAAVKTAVSAGKELVSVTKQIGEFFDGVDELRNNHNKKKGSIFSSDDENSMETFVKLQKAKDAEEDLRAIIISVRGYSAWAELQEIRARTRRERKEREEAAKKRKQEIVEKVIVIGGTVTVLSIITGIAVLVIMSSKGMI